MAFETILQHWILTNFILPFLLIFFIIFGILEKTKLFGEGTKQLNAFISFVIGLVFVGAIFPKLVVENLILFFTVAIVVLFIALLLWGFISGEEAKIPGKLKAPAGALVAIAVVVALLWALGIEGSIFDFLFRQSWSGELWTNVAFVAVVIFALVAVLWSKKE
jgi:hypothetical protein